MPVTNRDQVSPLPFWVKPVHPSGIVSVSDGKLSAVRQFQMEWRNVDEFTQRVLGKFFQDGPVEGADGNEIPENWYPVFPAKYPSDTYTIYASSVTVDVEKSSRCAFRISKDGEEGEEMIEETANLQDISELEKYYPLDRIGEKHYAVVSVSYSEPEWSFSAYDSNQILVNTGIRCEVNPSYEVYTMPSRNLFFSDLPELAEDGSENDRSPKDDTKSYIIIPKSDITIHWSNIPVEVLCNIYDHLSKFRGKVNVGAWGGVLYGNPVPSDIVTKSCEFFPAETVLFVDFEEDLSRRTHGFKSGAIDMNTTTIKLHLKVKHVTVFNLDVMTSYGWNHIPTDHSQDRTVESWSRVKVKVGDQERDLFETINFGDLLSPNIYT